MISGRQQYTCRTEGQQTSQTTARSPLSEISDLWRFDSPPSQETKRRAANCIIHTNNYDENTKDRFELMNIKIVVYGLTGLVCEQEEGKKKQKFVKKEIIFPKAIGISRRDMRPVGQSHRNNALHETENITTAVVSCQKHGTNSKVYFETFLPSLPLSTPTATSLSKVCYAAAWPSEQAILQRGEGAKEMSSFSVTRCMKQSSFVPGVGARSNYCHETIELGINISRGTELIRLGTALIVINGEEEGEVEMNVPATPYVFDSKKLKKKKNKYGYFSNDSSKRFFLDKNSVLKVGVQVIPEDAMRFAKAKQKTKERRENQLTELLEQDRIKTILEELGNENLDFETKQSKRFSSDPPITFDGVQRKQEGGINIFLPNMLCGSIPTSWVPNFLKKPENEDVPREIHTDNDLDQLVIRSLISSVSEATDDDLDFIGDLIDGEL